MSNIGENNTLTLTMPTANVKEPVRFFGTFQAKVAAGTNQLTLPKMLKKAVEEGDEGHLMLVPREDQRYWQLFTRRSFNQILEDTKSDPKAQEKGRGKKLARKLASTALPIETDTQGRFVISREFTAKLGGESNDVVFESAHTHVRLWTQKDFNAEQERIKAEEADELN